MNGIFSRKDIGDRETSLIVGRCMESGVVRSLELRDGPLHGGIAKRHTALCSDIGDVLDVLFVDGPVWRRTDLYTTGRSFKERLKSSERLGINRPTGQRHLRASDGFARAGSNYRPLHDPRVSKVLTRECDLVFLIGVGTDDF